MTIHDANAIPESADSCVEYATEAETAWNAGEVDRADDLYGALLRSAFATDSQKSLANHRIGLAALNAGDHDRAWDHLQSSKEPGVAELLRSIDNATPDAAPDAGRPPESTEESDTYWANGAAAMAAGDWAVGVTWFEAIAQSQVIDPGHQAKAMAAAAHCLHQLGRDDEARSWLEYALPAIDQPAALEEARKLMAEIGSQSTTGATPAEDALEQGISDFELGDLIAAKSALQAVANLDGATTELTGRAEYYLGSIAYNERRYGEARAHLQQAVEQAPTTEAAWASDMLTWRWED